MEARSDGSWERRCRPHGLGVAFAGSMAKPTGSSVNRSKITGAFRSSFDGQLPRRVLSEEVIEIPRGGLVEAFLERGFHVYTLNPKQVDRFRDRHSVAGAKDDRRDAYVLADAPRTALHKFRRVALDDPLVIQIREIARDDEDLREEMNRLTNRLREQLYRVAPLAPRPDGDAQQPNTL